MLEQLEAEPHEKQQDDEAYIKEYFLQGKRFIVFGLFGPVIGWRLPVGGWELGVIWRHLSGAFRWRGERGGLQGGGRTVRVINKRVTAFRILERGSTQSGGSYRLRRHSPRHVRGPLGQRLRRPESTELALNSVGGISKQTGGRDVKFWKWCNFVLSDKVPQRFPRLDLRRLGFKPTSAA